MNRWFYKPEREPGAMLKSRNIRAGEKSMKFQSIPKPKEVTKHHHQEWSWIGSRMKPPKHPKTLGFQVGL
jgi:hypothetical protein